MVQVYLAFPSVETAFFIRNNVLFPSIISCHSQDGLPQLSRGTVMVSVLGIETSRGLALDRGTVPGFTLREQTLCWEYSLTSRRDGMRSYALNIIVLSISVMTVGHLTMGL